VCRGGSPRIARAIERHAPGEDATDEAGQSVYEGKMTVPNRRDVLAIQNDSWQCFDFAAEEVSIYRVIGSPARPAASARATLGE
jgi:hypothetical protein